MPRVLWAEDKEQARRSRRGRRAMPKGELLLPRGRHCNLTCPSQNRPPCVPTTASADVQIEEETGASVTTKGTWIHDRSKMMPDETPLYIHIVAKTHTSLQAAAEKVQALIDKELGPLLDARTMAARNRALGLPPPEGWLPGGRVKWPEAKLDIGLESLRNFNVRAKTVGPGVSNNFALLPFFCA